MRNNHETQLDWLSLQQGKMASFEYSVTPQVQQQFRALSQCDVNLYRCGHWFSLLESHFLPPQKAIEFGVHEEGELCPCLYSIRVIYSPLRNESNDGLCQPQIERKQRKEERLKPSAVAPPPVPHSANIPAQPTYSSRHKSEPNNDFTEFDDMATWDDSVVDKIKTFTNHPKDNFTQMKAPKQVDQNDNRQHQPVAIHNSSAFSSAERTVSLSLQVVSIVFICHSSQRR